MGSMHSLKSKTGQISKQKDDSIADALNLKKYSKLVVIGKGGFGKVWKIQAKKDRKLFALKQMSKASAFQEER